MPDKDLLRLEVDPYNQPVLVALDVEDSARPDLVGFGPGLPNVVQVSPHGLFLSLYTRHRAALPNRHVLPPRPTASYG